MATPHLVSDTQGLPPDRLPFAPYHPWDRNAFLAFVALAWAGIAIGFGSEIARHVAQHAAPYPLIVHAHAAAFMGWLVLFTVQVLLVRTRRLALHRNLGLGLVAWGAIMVVLGPATALIVDAGKVGTPASDPAFLIVQFTDIAAFAILGGAGVALREQASAHKRLMLLSLLYITDAGFARFLFGPVRGLMGAGFVSTFVGAYLGSDLIILAVGAYDWITRRRLHPAYVAGVALVLALELLANSLYFNPAWKAVALRLLGH